MIVSLVLYRWFLHLPDISLRPPHNCTIAWDAQLRVQADHSHPFQYPAVQLLTVTMFFVPTDMIWLLHYELPRLVCINELSPSRLHAPLFLGSDKSIVSDDFYTLFQIEVLNVASLQTDSKQKSLLSSLIPDHLGRLFGFRRSWIRIWTSKLC